MVDYGVTILVDTESSETQTDHSDLAMLTDNKIVQTDYFREIKEDIEIDQPIAVTAWRIGGDEKLHAERSTLREGEGDIDRLGY